MSVIQRIRDRGAWIMLVLIALALIAFILQDGLGRGRGSSIFDNSSTVGSVNGVKISREEFESKVTQYSGRGNSRENVIPGVWNQFVYDIIQQQEYDKLGLTVSNKELTEYLYGPQSPLMNYQELSFLKTENGQLDPAKTQEWFANIKKAKNPEGTKQIIEMIIDPAIKQLLNEKYQTLVQKSAYVPTWLVEKQKADNAAISSFSYVYVPYSTITDTTIKASDDEIMKYVNKHSKMYQKDEETRTFSYVAFDASASAEDSATALNKVKDLKAEFAASTDAKAFLGKNGTELPYSDAYVLKSKLKMPNADSIKALSVGQTFGPYLDVNNYVVAKLIGVKNLPDSVSCSHILVRTGEGGLSDSLASKRIDSAIAAIAAGADFKTVMEKVSDDKAATTQNNGVMKFDANQIQSTNFDEDFAKFILFDGKQGESKKVKTKFGYHYIKIIEQKNFEPAINVAYLAKSISVSNETSSAASTEALKFAANAKNKELFEENAKKMNKSILNSQEVRESDYTLPIFGQSPSARTVIRWLFENDLGAINEPVDIGDKFVVPMIVSISKKGLISVGEAKQRGVSGLVVNEKKAKKIIDEKFKGSTLESYSASAGVPVQKADSVSLANPSIPNIGYEPAVLGSAFNKELQTKASSPIAGNSGVVALKIASIGAKPSTGDNESVKQTLLQSMRNASSRSGEALKKAATIKDNRLKMNY